LERYPYYAALGDIGSLVARAPELTELLQQACGLVVDHTGSTLTCVVLAEEPGGDNPRIAAWAGPARDYLAGLPVCARNGASGGDDIVGRVYRHGGPLAFDDTRGVPSFGHLSEALSDSDVPAAAGIPISIGERCRGVLVAAAAHAGHYRDDLVGLLQRVAEVLAVGIDRAEAREHSIRFQALYQALSDVNELTGLPNRAMFMDRLAVAISRAARGDEEVAVALIDLDNFKEINDRLGHGTGDEVIRQLAAAVVSTLRKSDTLARLGGDELVALLPLEGRGDGIENIMQRVFAAVARPFPAGSERLSVRMSAGVAVYPRDGLAAEDLLRRADLAMYRVKRQGGNAWGVFEPALEARLVERHRVRDRFARALERGAIAFHYQPIVDLRSGVVTGAEVLVRWNDPGRATPGPGDWSGAVESDPRLAAELGRRALHVAAGQLGHWHADGRQLSLSVDVDVRYLLSERFLEDLRTALAEAPRLASRLVLEVAEAGLEDNHRRVADVLASARGLGVRVALDGFGTARASLAYLLELPVDGLKIDRGCVVRMLTDVRAFGVVATAGQGAWTLGMTTVAEGVETERHGFRLMQMGCDCAQGSAVAPPMDAAAFGEWLAAWKPPASWSSRGGSRMSPEHTQLLASLILHRTRFGSILDAMARENPRGTLPVPVGSRCPVDRWGDARAARLLGRRLNAIHRRMHEIEDECLRSLAVSGSMPSRLRERAASTVSEYERSVDALIDAGAAEGGS